MGTGEELLQLPMLLRISRNLQLSGHFELHVQFFVHPVCIDSEKCAKCESSRVNSLELIQ